MLYIQYKVTPMLDFCGVNTKKIRNQEKNSHDLFGHSYPTNMSKIATFTVLNDSLLTLTVLFSCVCVFFYSSVQNEM